MDERQYTNNPSQSPIHCVPMVHPQYSSLQKLFFYFILVAQCLFSFSQYPKGSKLETWGKFWKVGGVHGGAWAYIRLPYTNGKLEASAFQRTNIYLKKNKNWGRTIEARKGSK